MPRLETTHPINWQTNLMTTEGTDEYRNPYGHPGNRGLPAVVVMDASGNLFAISGSDDSLQRNLGEKARRIMGRGILIESLGKDVWFVSWRAYWPQPVLVIPEDPHPTAAMVRPCP